MPTTATRFTKAWKPNESVRPNGASAPPSGGRIGSAWPSQREAAQTSVSTKASPTKAFPSIRRRSRTRPCTNGAAAISVQARSRPTTPDQDSERPLAWPPSTGEMEKQSVEAAPTKNPLASRRSMRRPSTENRTPARTATAAPASVTAVWSTRRASSPPYEGRRPGYATKSASVAASSPKRRTSPQRNASSALLPSLSIVTLVGTAAAADKPARAMADSVLIVDDHPLTREALGALLAQHGFSVVGQASDGEEAIGSARRLQPRLVLLDLSMPGLSGLEALPRLREAAPGCEVVVLTASGTEENLLSAIRGGAAGYLLKSEPPGRIAEFLRGVARGEAALSGEIARRLLDEVRNGGRRSGVPDAIARVLSAREVEVLLLLDEHLGTDQIARRLFISEHTVRSHVKSLLRKLGVSSRREALEALATARG